jgi:phosphate-selective porin OprO/OprP
MGGWRIGRRGAPGRPLLGTARHAQVSTAGLLALRVWCAVCSLLVVLAGPVRAEESTTEDAPPAPRAAPTDIAPAPVLREDERHALERGVGGRLASQFNAAPHPLGVHWNQGLWLVNIPNKFSLKVNFRMDLDYVGINDTRYVDAGGRTGNNPSGGQLRRARYTMRGDFARYAYWKMSVEVTDQSSGLRDNYIDWQRLDARGPALLPSIRIGDFFEPFSLEQQTPSGRLTFMSRAAPTLAMGLGRSLGVMIYDDFANQSFGYQLGTFVSPMTSLKDFGTRIVDDTLVRDGYGITGRIWWMPGGARRGGCQRLLFGLSMSQRLQMDGVRFRARPEAHKFQHVSDTNFSMDAAGDPILGTAENLRMFGAEAAWTHGALGLQGEYYVAHVQSLAAGDPIFHGGYVQASWWLTGECRLLSRGDVRPVEICRPRDPCLVRSGWGGVELVGRVSHLDLNDGSVFGGTQLDVTVGLNWHLAERRRVMLNLVRAQVDDGIANEPIWILQTRLQLEF